MAIQTTVGQPTAYSLGSTVNVFPKAQNDVIVDIIDTLNDAINGSISTVNLTLTGDLAVGDDTTMTGRLDVDDTTASTSTITGAVVIDGGVGIAKELFVSTTTPASISATGVLSVTNATASTSTVTGAVKVTGGVGIAKELFVSTTTPFSVSAAGVVTVTNATASTTKDTGALIITDGGLGVEGAINAGTFIQAGAGAVGTPSIRVNATNTGLYEVSSVQTGFAQDGVLVATFDGSGMKIDSVRAGVQIGSTPVGTVSITEYGDSKDMTTVLTLTNFIVGALAGAGASLGLGNIVYAYPAGQHLELVSSLSSIVLTAAGTAVNTDTGLGSVIATGAVSVLSGTATFEDRLTGQTIATAAGGGAAASALTAATAGIGTGISLNVAGSVKNVFLNSAGAWNADNTGNLTATGTIVLKWTRM